MDLLARGVYNVMVAVQGVRIVPVPLDQIVGHKKFVSLDHDWISDARSVGTCLGLIGTVLQRLLDQTTPTSGWNHGQDQD